MGVFCNCDSFSGAKKEFYNVKILSLVRGINIMVKVYTLNYHYGNNYGAVLEAYALQKTIEKLGYESICINFIPNEPQSFKVLRRILWAFTKPEMAVHYVVTLIKKILKFDSEITKYKKTDQNGFDIFRKQNLKIDEHKCSSISDLDHNFNNIEVCVCGSDVIWATGNNSLVSGAYFLNWGNLSMKRVAYAPSWGKSSVDALNVETKTRLSDYLSKFDHVSVREKSGVDICKKLGRHDSVWLPDPTLLISSDEWNQIAAIPQINEVPYLLHYFVPYNETISSQVLVNTIKTELSLDLLTIPDLTKQSIGGEVWPSPTKWISAIRDSNFIVTNSFHGVVFCILFHRPFVFTSLIGKDAPKNERIYSLLEKFNISERIISSPSDENINSIINSLINWEEVDEIKNAWREKGIRFLEKALKD
jgi:hypothetical protein